MTTPRRGRRRALAISCAAASLIAAAPAAAFQAPKDRMISVEMTLAGSHRITWQYADPAYPDKNRAWQQGSGTQTLTVSTSQPVRFKANLITSSDPTFGRLVPLLLIPTTPPRPLSGALTRTQDWNAYDPAVCDREGGCLDNLLVPMPNSVPSCPQVNVSVPLKLGAQILKIGRAPRMGIYAELSGSFNGLWPNCPPDIGGVRRPLALAQPPRVYFTGAIHKMFVMQRGQTATVRQTVKRSAIDGEVSAGCSKPLTGAGLHECAVTDLTLQIKRLH